MNIFVYSDESGVFDKKHNEVFVFGGLIFLSKEDKDIATRKYVKAERDLRKSGSYAENIELKASLLKNNEKDKLYRSLNNVIKFGAVINQNHVNDNIFRIKKSKQRYLDYVFKIALKRAFEVLISKKKINIDDVDNIYVFVDEHSTATNGCYELEEGLEEEFKNGTFNFKYDKFFPPLFRGMKSVSLKYCNSKSIHLIRASDIIANKLYYLSGKKLLFPSENLIITYFP